MSFKKPENLKEEASYLEVTRAVMGGSFGYEF